MLSKKPENFVCFAVNFKSTLMTIIVSQWNTSHVFHNDLSVNFSKIVKSNIHIFILCETVFSFLNEFIKDRKYV